MILALKIIKVFCYPIQDYVMFFCILSITLSDINQYCLATFNMQSLNRIYFTILTLKFINYVKKMTHSCILHVDVEGLFLFLNKINSAFISRKKYYIKEITSNYTLKFFLSKICTNLIFSKIKISWES